VKEHSTAAFGPVLATVPFVPALARGPTQTVLDFRSVVTRCGSSQTLTINVAITFTVMPPLAFSSASTLVKPMSPAVVAE
jgi:hypothetical protein